MNDCGPVNSLAGRRILVGPNEIAGFTSRIAVALARGGAEVRFFNGRDHPFNPHVADTANLRRIFRRAIGVASRWQTRGGLPALAGVLLAGMVKLVAFAQACVWAQTFVMVGGKGFFGGGLEYAILRLLGRRVIHVFVGTASRPRYLSGYAKGVVKDGVINAKGLRQLARRTRRQARRIRGISRHASVVIENPLCGHFYEKPFVNFFKLGAPLDVAALVAHPRLTDATPPRPAGEVRVLHCPSRPEIKGSARIQAVMARLTQEGLPLEFRQLTGVPRAQVLHEITQCDFVVDELYSDAPLAGFAAEAAAFGKAAVVGGYGWELFRDFLRAEEIPPTATCHPDDLERVVRALALDAARREELGDQARQFLQQQWTETRFAENFTRIVAGDIPGEWWFPPEQVSYLHGMGLDENEARQLVGALAQRHGPTALQVDHLPRLREKLIAFAAGQPAAYGGDSPSNPR